MQLSFIFFTENATEGNNSSSKKQKAKLKRERNYEMQGTFSFLTIYDIFLQN